MAPSTDPSPSTSPVQVIDIPVYFIDGQYRETADGDFTEIQHILDDLQTWVNELPNDMPSGLIIEIEDELHDAVQAIEQRTRAWGYDEVQRPALF